MSAAAIDRGPVIAVFAHPDDESLACGGTLARLAASGEHVIVITASHGERGSQSGPARDDELGRQRAVEMRAAAAMLGIAELIIWDHPDGELRWRNVADFHADLLMFMERRRPSAVITFGEDGLYWHQDHIGVHERTTTAVRTMGVMAPPLYYVTMPRGVMPEIVARARAAGWTPGAKGFWSLQPEAFGLHAEPPTIVIDVSDWVRQKLAALECHQSQVGRDHPFARMDDDEARRLLALEYFTRADVPTNAPPFLEQLCDTKP